ncbi:hypothetical protein [Mycobacterium hubeiense]|uniref:hypothetical protein n=1 Tax=Mycobacterium hubeiense TaxID=1867256 RepID=UPI0027D1F720|nr:hypothetical protein [Mycobacterium sp. QGD 101]
MAEIASRPAITAASTFSVREMMKCALPAPQRPSGIGAALAWGVRIVVAHRATGAIDERMGVGRCDIDHTTRTRPG